MNDKKRKPISFMKGIKELFSHKLTRNILIIGILFLAQFLLLLQDPSNGFEKILPALQHNFILNFLKSIHFKTIDVGVREWIIVNCIMIAVFVYLVGNIFDEGIIRWIAGILQKKFPQQTAEKTNKTAKTVYYCLLTVLYAIVLIFYGFFGGFKLFVNGDGNLITGFIKTIIAYVLCLIICIVVLVAVYCVFKIVAWVLGYIIHTIMDCTRKVNGFIYGNVSASVLSEETADATETAMEPATATETVSSTVSSSAPMAMPATAAPTVSASSVEEEQTPPSPELLFPTLSLIDKDMEENVPVPTQSTTLSPEEFVLRFQAFASEKHSIYYGLPLLRTFLAGMAVSRLIILEGLSGTGKSMLPRMFSEFTGSKRFFAPVQATWRDKSDLLGYYSEFTHSFKTTDFLAELYSASYTDRPNLMVLDEMNISRVEYYFADFLSVLEYPDEDWKIRVYEPEVGQELPKQLTGGYVHIPTNTWFIGTANSDDSTFTITDKVCDRAIMINFKEKISPITTTYDSDPISITAEDLTKIFEDAKNNEEYRLTEEETQKFLQLCDFMRDAFDVRFGNRVMVQIEGFVPVYVALGGSKVEALDRIFATKIMRKLNGVYEEFVREELNKLTNLLNEAYGKDAFRETRRSIAKIMKRLV